MGLGRLELPTSPLSGVRSNHLSYRPVVALHWWSWSGSNRRPPECKSGALPAELQPLNPTEARYREPVDSTGSRIRSYFPRPIGRRIGIPDPNSEELLEREQRTKRHSMDRNGCHLLSTLRRLSVTPATFSLRKEVIQPQVLLRLPCYDFTPIMSHTLGRCPPCGSACRLLVQPTFVM